jgi:hypothetical protein
VVLADWDCERVPVELAVSLLVCDSDWVIVGLCVAEGDCVELGLRVSDALEL